LRPVMRAVPQNPSAIEEKPDIVVSD
jgi:hypothetical protein